MYRLYFIIDVSNTANEETTPATASGTPSLTFVPEFAACEDSIDSEGDDFTDFFGGDPGCQTPSYWTENPQCQDGVHNDGDGKMDYDAGLSASRTADPTVPDPQCLGNPWKNREAKPASTCGLGAEMTLLLPPLIWIWRRRSLP